MEQLRAWMLGVAACALLTSLAEQFTTGAARRCVRFIGGLLLALALLAPLRASRWDDLTVPDLRASREESERQLQAEYDAALRRGVEAELDARIAGRAAAYGCAVEAETEAAVENGVPEIVRVRLRGAYSPALEAYLTEELGIAKERLQWEE